MFEISVDAGICSEDEPSEEEFDNYLELTSRIENIAEDKVKKEQDIERREKGKGNRKRKQRKMDRRSRKMDV